MGRKRTGIRIVRGKYQVRVTVNGTPYSTTFPLATLDATMTAWQQEQIDLHDTRPVEQGSIEHAVIHRYLPTIVAKATFGQIVAHLGLWLDALGRDRTPESVTPFEIDCIMEGWKTTPSVFGKGQRGRPSAPDGLSDATIRKRRTSLRSFFVKLKKLNGGKGSNPVAGTWCPPSKKPEVRGTDYATIETILAAMPRWVDTKKGAPKVAALGYLRCGVIAHTGLPPGVLGTIKPKDVNYLKHTVYVEAGRDKGEGVPACTLELTPQGEAAFKALDKAKGFGKFAPGALNVSFTRAAKREGVVGLTVYDLRHSFGALVYETTRDQATVARFLMHAEGSVVTARYTAAANKSVDRAAATKVGEAIAAKAIGKSKGRVLAMRRRGR